MLKCIECNGPVSKNALACPHCGTPLFTSSRKRVHQWIRVPLLLLLIAVSCLLVYVGLPLFNIVFFHYP
jgi:hypothetical protein